MPSRLRREAEAMAALLLAAFVLFPSFGIIQKYLALRWALLYAIAGLVVAVVGVQSRHVIQARIDSIDRRWVWPATVALFAALVAAFLVLYPLSNSGASSWISPSGVIGGGSDRDEALNIGAAELLAWRYPYDARTHLGNPISQMPGSLFLALPFVLLGNAALQNVFWLAVFFLIVRRLLTDNLSALLFLTGLLAACPMMLQDFVTGGDLVANSVMVLLAFLWLLKEADRHAIAGWRLPAAAACAGVVLSSRASFWLLVPLLAGAVTRRAGARQASLCLLVAGAACAALTLPFYLHDPGGFSPLTAENKFMKFEIRAVASSTVLPLLGVAFSLCLAMRKGIGDLSTWLVSCGVVMLAPVVVLVALASLRTEMVNFTFAVYGLPAMIFGALGVVRRERDVVPAGPNRSS